MENFANPFVFPEPMQYSVLLVPTDWNEHHPNISSVQYSTFGMDAESQWTQMDKSGHVSFTFLHMACTKSSADNTIYNYKSYHCIFLGCKLHRTSWPEWITRKFSIPIRKYMNKSKQW